MQFEGQRRFPWQNEMAADLQQALAGLPVAPGEVLAGTYMTTSPARCDAENRLFTNLGGSRFPGSLTAIRFERGAGPLPAAPVPLALAGSHLHYYRYRLGGTWLSWESAGLLARWCRVRRRLPDDGSCRPVWLAMRQAAASGQVEVPGDRRDDTAAFGVRIVIHATSRGPRQAAVVSETTVDGIIAAFHAGLGPGKDAAAAAVALAPRLRDVSASEAEVLVAESGPGPLFASPAIIVKEPTR